MTRGTIWSRPCSAKGGVSMSGSCWSARADPRRGGVLPVDAVEVEAAVAQVLDRAALAAGQEVGEDQIGDCDRLGIRGGVGSDAVRSEEHTSELQSLMRISYAIFSLTQK